MGLKAATVAMEAACLATVAGEAVAAVVGRAVAGQAAGEARVEVDRPPPDSMRPQSTPPAAPSAEFPPSCPQTGSGMSYAV